MANQMEARASSVELCVVIVNYRTPTMVIDCLETLLPQAREVGAFVVVVDNASPDDSVSRLVAWVQAQGASDHVRIAASEENGGFAAGNNIGIETCDAPLYLLLNSDTLLREGALRRLLQTMAAEPRVGLLSPRLEWADGEPQESCFRFHRPASELIRAAATGLVTRALGRYEVAMRVSSEPLRPEWTSFACVLIRREVLRDIGLLDDGFFMYFEDVEHAFRAREAGWQVLHDPDARVVHLRGGSSPVKSRARERMRLPRYYYESRTRYFYQVHGRAGLLAANLLWTLGWGIASARRLVQRSFQPPSNEAEWRDIWINFGSPLAPYTHPQQGKE